MASLKAEEFFNLANFSPSGLALIAAIQRNAASYEHRDDANTLADRTEAVLLQSFAVTALVETGVHVDDVHLDAREALVLLTQVPKEQAEPFFVPHGLAAYTAALKRSQKNADAFAKAEGLATMRVVENLSSLTLHQLNWSARTKRESDPIEAARVYGLARDKAQAEGDDAAFFECERRIAVAGAGMDEGLIRLLSDVAIGRFRPERNDNGLHFARATWILLLCFVRASRWSDYDKLWQAAAAHDLAQTSAQWLGLRHKDANRDALFDHLEMRTRTRELIALALRCKSKRPMWWPIGFCALGWERYWQR
ncbi:MAG: hypothetical protein ACRCS3_07830 [Paracoccaceae bacterium]